MGLFEHSRIFFVWLSVTHLRINRRNIAIIQQSPLECHKALEGLLRNHALGLKVKSQA
jgi:hypothetical protein